MRNVNTYYSGINKHLIVVTISTICTIIIKMNYTLLKSLNYLIDFTTYIAG